MATGKQLNQQTWLNSLIKIGKWQSIANYHIAKILTNNWKLRLLSSVSHLNTNLSRKIGKLLTNNWQKAQSLTDSTANIYIFADNWGYIVLHIDFVFILTGTGKCSKDLCCEIFPGERPFSEKESSNVATYLANRSSELVAFLDIHSYSQMWLSPWGWKNNVPTEYYSEMVSRVLLQTVNEYSKNSRVRACIFSS